MPPTISVVITCYNLERFIAAAIESVLGQDLEGPFEIIIVDDCSTDASAAIIKSYPRLRYIKTESNSGVLLAMLDGIAATSGDLIFFLDGDDVWEPEKLAACVDAFEANAACALVTHDLTFVDGLGQPLQRPSRPREALAPLGAEQRSAKVRQGILLHGDYVWLGSALGIRRSLARTDKFVAWARSLPDPANTYQDWPLAFWIAAFPDNECVYVPQKLFRYRLHGANYSGDARDTTRALRNLKRTRNTLEAMLDIAQTRDLPKMVGTGLMRRIHSYIYLIDLYSGYRFRALAGFFGALPDFIRRGEGVKELIRLVAVLLMGPERFVRLSSRRRG